MNYNDENINLSNNDWQQMAREYEQTLQTLNTLPDNVSKELNSLFHTLLISYPNLKELDELNTAIKNLNVSNRDFEVKKSFFSTPISSINKRIYILSNDLLFSMTNINSDNIKNVLKNLLIVRQKSN